MNRTVSPKACKRLQYELETALPASGLRPAHEGTLEEFIRDCYIDILSRCPSSRELTTGLRELRAGKTREEYRYWLANTLAAKEACLNRPLVASLRSEIVARKRRLRHASEYSSELLKLLDAPANDRSAMIQALYQAVLKRQAVQEEVDGWLRLQERGLSDVGLLWAIVHSEERLQRNTEIPLGEQDLVTIVRKETTFKELMLLSGNAQLELGCQIFLKREAREDEKFYYSKQIAKGWFPSDALWKTISRKQSATFRDRKRALWKSICHPLTIGRWHLGHLLRFHVVRRMAATTNSLARRCQTLTAQMDSILCSHADFRQILANQQQWQESFGAQFETLLQALTDLQQRQVRLENSAEVICRSVQIQEEEQKRLAANPESYTEVSVQTARLDDVIPTDAKVDLVRIDAEGAELSILNGMQRIIAQNPMIQIVPEFKPANIAGTGKRAEELTEKIRELGFSIRGITETTGQLSSAIGSSPRFQGP